MAFLDETGLGRLWAQIILKLNSKVPDDGTTGQVLKKTETGTEWADESCAADAVQSNLDTHVNNTTIHVTAEEKSTWNAKLDSYTETDPTVPDWAKQPNKPDYTAAEIGATPASHVEDTTAHVTADEKSAWNESILIGESFIELPASKEWFITYGDNKFVAVAYGSNIAMYSLDGLTWNQTTLPNSLKWYSIAYGNGKFVAIATGTSIAAYSSDGITWSQTSLSSSGNWWDVTYGNGRFIAVMANSNVASYSDDGTTWTEITLPSSKFWYTITYGNSKFVALAYSSNAAIYSSDGITWTETTLPSSGGWYDVTYGDDKFVAVRYNSNVAAYSSDGITWIETALPISNHWSSIIYGSDKFVTTAFNDNGDIAAYSYNGIEWFETTMPAVKNWKSLAYGQNKFVALSDTTMAAYSLDGITWSNTKPSLQTVSGTDVTDDTKVILGVSDKQDKLTGTAGQIVGFDENGNAVAQTFNMDIDTGVTSFNGQKGAITFKSFYVGTSAPSDTNVLWIDTTNGLKYYNGTSWVVVPVGYSD